MAFQKEIIWLCLKIQYILHLISFLVLLKKYCKQCVFFSMVFVVDVLLKSFCLAYQPNSKAKSFCYVIKHILHPHKNALQTCHDFMFILRQVFSTYYDRFVQHKLSLITYIRFPSKFKLDIVLFSA